MILLVVMVEHLRQCVQEFVVCGRIFGNGVLVGKRGLSLKQWGRFISVVLDQF